MEGAADAYSSSDDGQTGEIKRTNKKIRKIRHEEKLQAQRKWPAKSADEEERYRIVNLANTNVTFQRRFRKQRKPLIGFIDVRVAHVESTKEVYLHILALEEASGDIQKALIECYGDPNNPVPTLPAEFIVMDNACVVYEPSDGMWYRCRIADIKKEGVTLQTVDFGKRLSIIRPVEYARLKVLLAGSCLDTPPRAYYCRIEQLCERQPTPTEGHILRELLPVGEKMRAEFERSREPWRVRMWYPETNTTFVEYFEKELDERGMRDIIDCERRPCTDVTIWQPPKHIEFQSGPNDKRQATATALSPKIAHTDEKKVEKTSPIQVVAAADRGKEAKTSPIQNAAAAAGGQDCKTSPTQSAAATAGAQEAKKQPTDHGYANDIDGK